MKTLILLISIALTSSVYADIIELNVIDYRTGEKLVPEQLVVTDLATNADYIFENTSSFDTDALTSVTQNASISQGLKIYPNPVADRCYIEIFSNGNKSDNLLISNSLGQSQTIPISLVQGDNVFELSQHNLTVGTYYVTTSEYSSILNLTNTGKSNSTTLERVSTSEAMSSMILTPVGGIYSVFIRKAGYSNYKFSNTDLTTIMDTVKLVNLDDFIYESTKFSFRKMSAVITEIIQDQYGNVQETHTPYEPHFEGEITDSKIFFDEDYDSDYMHVTIESSTNIKGIEFTLDGWWRFPFDSIVVDENRKFSLKFNYEYLQKYHNPVYITSPTIEYRRWLETFYEDYTNSDFIEVFGSVAK